MKPLFAGLLLIAAGAGAWYLPHLRSSADVGAGFVAKQTCSCVFVGERSLASCGADLPGSVAAVDAELLDAGEGVRAWVPLLGGRIARHQTPFGCTLEP